MNRRRYEYTLSLVCEDGGRHELEDQINELLTNNRPDLRLQKIDLLYQEPGDWVFVPKEKTDAK